MNYANYGWDFSASGYCEKLGKGDDHSPDSTQSMCALINGNLTGKTFLGNYQYDSNTLKYSLQDFFYDYGSPAHLILYQLADGMIVGMNKDGSCTKKYNKCEGFIDVNGREGDNRVIKCANSSDTKGIYASNYTDCTLESDIGDVIPIVFYDQTVEPASNAAMALFNGK
jgi:hypothetical protein